MSTAEPDDGRPGFEHSPPLAAREALVASELRRIDPQLEGLYRAGLEFCARGAVPGYTYIVAITGRELMRGVIRALTERTPDLSSAELATVGQDEKYRPDIARALQLHPRHPIVGTWLEMHRRFSGEGKYVAHRSTPSTAIADFLALSSMLVGRLSPYFSVQDEADALLAIEHPGEEHLARLRDLIVRPTLRSYFFRKLENPAWLPLLIRLGVFAIPPHRRVNEDQSWSVEPWPQGDFLVRAAPDFPFAVRDILMSLPANNDNPAVWEAAAQAMLTLEPKLAASCASRLLSGMKAQPHLIFHRSLVQVAAHIASVDAKKALELIDVMLEVRRREDFVVEGQEAEDRLRFSTRWLLKRLDHYDIAETVQALVEDIADADRAGVLRLVSAKLTAALRAMNPEFSTETARNTYFWCRDLTDSADDADDLRAILARTLLQVARDAINSEDSAAEVLQELTRLPAGIRLRLMYALAAIRPPFLVASIDEMLRWEGVLEFDAPGREVGQVLRSRFSHASEEAQRAFIRTLRKGPLDDDLDRIVEWESTTGGPGTRESALAHWQKRHLRRFGRNLPAALVELARSIGHEPVDPTAEELALAEIGWSIGGATWRGSESPIADADLQSTDLSELPARIKAWTPKSAGDEADLRGLSDAMQRVAAKDPERGISIALALVRVGTLRGTSGVLYGLRDAGKSDMALPWTAVGELVTSLMKADRGGESDQWHNALAALITFGEDAVVEQAPMALVDKLLADGEALLRDEEFWSRDEFGGEFVTFDGIVTASINVLPARLLALIIRLSLRKSREESKGLEEGHAAEHRASIGAALDRVIASVLERKDRSGLAAQAAAGTYLAHLRWLSPGYWTRNQARLLHAGIPDPIRHPLWGAFLSRGRLYDDAFKAFRPTYALAAQTAPRVLPEKASRTWEPAAHLVEHVLHAFLRGLADLGDADAVVENTFANALPEDVGSAMWAVFRSWTDAAENGNSPPAEFVTRLTAFWRWRLDQLELSRGEERSAQEADGLLWLCRTPGIDTRDVMGLGLRTLRITSSASGNLHSLWECFAELAIADANLAFAMLKRAIEIELGSKWPHFPIDELKPAFEAVFAGGSAQTKEAALRLIDQLGDRGFTSFGQLRPGR